MHTPARLVACSTCACHYRAEEPGCPHCGSAWSGRHAAALMLGLALAGGCKSVAMYGTAITGPVLAVNITTPADDANLSTPGDVEVVATVLAVDVDLNAIDVVWAVDEVAACDDAAVDAEFNTTCIVSLSDGDHTIAVSVFDPVSEAGEQDEVLVHVGAEPSL